MKIKANIILIGFMGVGKGRVARELAKSLNCFTLDTDDLIESFMNQKIKDIFEDSGESEFRNIEAKLAKFLEHSVSNAVISTGGGFYKVKNLKKIGILVYLKSSFEKIIERIKNSQNAEKKFAKRPLLSNLNEAKKLHSFREKEYKKKANITINVEDKTTQEIVKDIIEILKKGKF